MKKILVSILSVLMVLALAAPVSAEGPAESLPNSAGEYTPLTTAYDGVALSDGVVYGLDENLELNSLLITSGANVTIYLNGYTLTLKAVDHKTRTTIEGGASLTILNGSVVAESMNDGSVALFSVQALSSIKLDNVKLKTNGTGILARGNAASVVVTNGSVIEAGGYAVGTNAATDANYNVKIELSDSTFSADCGVLFNVPGSLKVTDSVVNGTSQGMLIRSGTVTLSGSKVTTSATTPNNYESENWGSGNSAPNGAIVFGDKSSGNAYDTEVSTLDISNCNVTSNNDAVPAIYTHDNKLGDGDTTHHDRVLKIDGQTFVTGAINNKNTVKTSVAGGTFSKPLPDGLVSSTVVQATVGEGDTALYAIGKASIESTSKDNPTLKVTLTNVPAGTVLNLPAGTRVENDDADGQSANINGVELAPNDGEIEAPIPTPEKPSRPTYRPSSPSKDLPSNTKECQKEFGDEYIWSDEYDACVIKFMIVDTSTK